MRELVRLVERIRGNGKMFSLINKKIPLGEKTPDEHTSSAQKKTPAEGGAGVLYLGFAKKPRSRL
jgi:hypothetical protein